MTNNKMLVMQTYRLKFISPEPMYKSRHRGLAVTPGP